MTKHENFECVQNKGPTYKRMPVSFLGNTKRLMTSIPLDNNLFF